MLFGGTPDTRGVPAGGEGGGRAPGGRTGFREILGPARGAAALMRRSGREPFPVAPGVDSVQGQVTQMHRGRWRKALRIREGWPRAVGRRPGEAIQPSVGFTVWESHQETAA